MKFIEKTKRLLNKVSASGKSRKRLNELELRIKHLERAIAFLRSHLDVGADTYNKFQSMRESSEYVAVFDKPEPLVTICTTTYNRGDILADRSVRSSLAQSYKNIELIVIGDCCTDNTATRMAEITDPRLTFINLPERGNYPKDPLRRWCVAGTTPVNLALSLAKGDFITHLDDDDEHLPDRVEKLVKFAQAERADLVYHPFSVESSSGKWRSSNTREFVMGQVTTSSIFYHRWFANIGWDLDAHLVDEPGDWNRLRKFLYLGAKISLYPEALLRMHRPGTQRNG